MDAKDVPSDRFLRRALAQRGGGSSPHVIAGSVAGEERVVVSPAEKQVVPGTRAATATAREVFE